MSFNPTIIFDKDFPYREKQNDLINLICSLKIKYQSFIVILNVDSSSDFDSIQQFYNAFERESDIEWIIRSTDYKTFLLKNDFIQNKTIIELDLRDGFNQIYDENFLSFLSILEQNNKLLKIMHRVTVSNVQELIKIFFSVYIDFRKILQICYEPFLTEELTEKEIAFLADNFTILFDATLSFEDLNIPEPFNKLTMILKGGADFKQTCYCNKCVENFYFIDKNGNVYICDKKWSKEYSFGNIFEDIQIFYNMDNNKIKDKLVDCFLNLTPKNPCSKCKWITACQGFCLHHQLEAKNEQKAFDVKCYFMKRLFNNCWKCLENKVKANQIVNHFIQNDIDQNNSLEVNQWKSQKN